MDMTNELNVKFGITALCQLRTLKGKVDSVSSFFLNYQVIIRLSVLSISRLERSCGFVASGHKTDQRVLSQGREKKIESAEQNRSVFRGLRTMLYMIAVSLDVWSHLEHLEVGFLVNPL